MMSRPLQRGTEISTITLTLMNLPPSLFEAPGGWMTDPMASQICSATSLFLNLTGISKTCTKKATCFKSKGFRGVSLSYRVSTIKCLSKDQGSDLRIRSTSPILSKEKRIRWLPRFLILNLVLALHRGVKVLAMASMLRGHLVRNLAAMAVKVQHLKARRRTSCKHQGGRSKTGVIRQKKDPVHMTKLHVVLLL